MNFPVQKEAPVTPRALRRFAFASLVTCLLSAAPLLAQHSPPLVERFSDTQGTSSAAFGSAVACLGPNALVAAPSFAGGTRGRVYVYQRVGDASPRNTIILDNPDGSTPFPSYGARVLMLSGANGPLAVVSAPDSDFFSSPQAGRVYAYDLAAPTPTVVADGFFNNQRLGSSLTTIDDANRDGGPDIVVLEDNGFSFQGQVYTLGPDGNFLIGRIPASSPGSAPSAASAADFTADGVADIIVGVSSPFQPPAPTPTVPANVSIYQVLPIPTATPALGQLDILPLTSVEDDPGIRFGHAVAGDPHFIVDSSDGGGTSFFSLGTPALAVGAPGFSLPGSDVPEGRLTIYSYPDVTGMPPALVCTIVGPAQGAALGTAVDTVGDTNGNGRPEFLVSAPGLNVPEALEAGALYLVEWSSASATCEVFGPYVAATPRDFGALGRAVGGRTTSGGECNLVANRNDSFDLPDVLAGEPIGETGPEHVRAFAAPTATFTPTPTATPTATRTPPPPTITPDPTPQAAATGIPPQNRPTSAELDFRIDRQGDFTGALVLDRDPLKASSAGALEAGAVTCDLRVFARLGIPDRGGRARLGPIEQIFRGTVSRQRTILFANGLPAVASVNGTQPAVYMAAAVDCGESRLLTEQFGRNLSCGVAPRSAAGPWLGRLKRSLRAVTGTGVRPRGTDPRKKRCLCSKSRRK